MKKIKILLANRPRIMDVDAWKVIDAEEDMEVVNEVLGLFKVLTAIRETKADAVILALKGSEEPGLCSHLLAEYPDLTILCLSSGDEAAFIEQLCPRRLDILEPSEANILNALRQAVRTPCTSYEAVKNQHSKP